MDSPQDSTTLATFETYRDVLYRRRWWFLLIAFGVWLGGWSFAWLLPAIYRSESVILIEQQKVPEQYVVPNVAIDVQERLHSMTQMILSRTRLERIIDDLHLYTKERSRGSNMEELVDRMRKDIRIDLVQSPGKRDELTAFKISYSSSDPRVAQQVTSQLTSLFIEENLRARQQQSESTTGFLQNQLEDARKQLADQEQRIRDFKGQHLGELPGQMQSNVGILTGLQGRLEAESDALNRAKQQDLYMRSLLEQYRAVHSQAQKDKSDVPLSDQLDREISTLKTQIADLATRYTERHPDLVKARKQLEATEALKKKVDAEAKDSKADLENPDKPRTASEINSMTPIIQLESQLKANDRELKDRQRTIDSLSAEIGDYQRRLNETPVREQQLADLSRDYDQSRTNYDSLLAKKNQSELATNLEKRQQGEQLRVLDPPSLPAKPYSPDRFRYSFFALVAGCILGMLVLAGLEAIDDRVHSESDMKEFSTPVLVEIPRILLHSEDKALRLRRRVEWAAAAVIVMCIGIGNALAYYRG